MIKSDKKTVVGAYCVVALILAAYSMRFLMKASGEPWSSVLQLIREVIYTGIVIAWGFSVSGRVIHPRVRRLFTAIACIMIFWLIIRFVKFELSDVYMSLKRYLWYFYYIPMLFIPVLAFRISIWLGRPEGYRLPKWTNILYPIAAVLLIFVLTNDIHQTVFTFPADAAVYSDYDYSYGPLFYPVFAWRVGGLLLTVGMILVKSRVPESRRYLLLPVIPSVLLLCYGIDYVTGGLVTGKLEDLTVMECMLIIAIFESCIRCGLIPSNTHYAEFFEKLGYPGAIIDENGSVVYRSESFSPLPKEKLMGVAEGGTDLGNGLILRSMSIRGGYILWTEDVSEFLELQHEAEETAKQLAEEQDLLQAEIKMKQDKAVLETRNRLYDSVDQEMSPQFAELKSLVSAEYKSGDEKKTALCKMCVIGAYIKRRCNLLFINEQQKRVSSDELVFCVRESADYIGIYGADCVLNAGRPGIIPTGNAILAYDVFECVVEAVLLSLTAMLINLEADGSVLKMNIQSECGAGGIAFSEIFDRVRSAGGELEIAVESGVIYTRLSLPAGEV